MHLLQQNAWDRNVTHVIYATLTFKSDEHRITMVNSLGVWAGDWAGEGGKGLACSVVHWLKW